MDDKGRTALMFAAYSEEAKGWVTLFDNGADQSIKDKEGRLASDYIALGDTAREKLHPVVAFGRELAIQFLIVIGTALLFGLSAI